MKNCVFIALAALLVGCSHYSWKSEIPESKRAITVPTFRNESNVVELGAVVSRQVLREIQREGTFKLATSGDAALEVQGTVKSASSGVLGYARDSGVRHRERSFDATAIISVIDKQEGKVIIDNRVYSAHTTFIASHDTITGMRDASGRIAEDFARQIVDDLLALKLEGEKQ